MNSFSRLGLSQPIVDAISDLGYIDPTEIQELVIPILLQEKTDLVGLAQTGTGKTAAFGLPLVQQVVSDQRYPQALVLAPTRELCLQVSGELMAFAKGLPALQVTSVYGGADISRQIREIRRGTHIIIATPGRLRDLIRRGAVDLSRLSIMVLDEADEMLNMGFKEEIDDILQHTPEDKQTWLFSATMPNGVRRIAKDYMTDPLEVSAGKPNTANANIDHQYVVVRRQEKYDALRRFLDYDPESFALVFTRTRREAANLSEDLARDGYRADALHGDMSQSQRDRVMQGFRDQHLQVLVATDVAARGIDVQDISHVFHYNIPDDLAFYTHRSGRTGRAGSEGISLVLAEPAARRTLRAVEKRLKIDFTEVNIPTGADICAKRLLHEVNHLKDVTVSSDLEPFFPQVEDALESLSREELIRKITALTFRGSMRQYLNAPDLNSGKGNGRKDRETAGRRRTRTRLFINIGQIDLKGKGDLLKLICREADISGDAIGKIEFRAKHTFFDVDEDIAETVIRKMSDMTLDGRPIRVNREEGKPKGGKKKKGKRSSFKKKKKSSRKRSFA